MSYSVNWTLKAKKAFAQNLEYLFDEWNITVANKFIDRVDEVILKIRENPFLYPIHSPNTGIRKCILNERILLFYEVIDDSTIDIITFWNTYQNPDKLEF